MKIAIISPDYPSENSSSFAFVHVRAKFYQEFGQAVEAFILSDKEIHYQFEGISIHKILNKSFSAQICKYNPDILAVHYPTFWMIPVIQKLNYPTVVWILGHEILWSCRLLSSRSYLDWLKKRIVLFPRLIVQMYLIRNFLKEADSCVFVSNWLLKAAEKHLVSEFTNVSVIPNPVDTKLFKYQQPKDIDKGISVRSLERSVYGLDIAIKAFAKFEMASLTIYGRGQFLKKYTKMIGKYKSNSTMRAEHIAHEKLSELYHRFGFFVAPSREETQGLAMCEAMACGHPVVASRVGGIPEFVRDGVDGYLVPPNNPKALREAVVRLLSDKKRFFEMSRNARRHIELVCGAEAITERELSVMEKAQMRNQEWQLLLTKTL